MDDFEALAVLEAGLHVGTGVAALQTGELRARAAALQGDWAQTQALYDEALANDELLAGLAQAEVEQAASGFRAGRQLARIKLDQIGQAQKDKRRVRLRAQVAAASAAQSAGAARTQGAATALGNIGLGIDTLQRVNRQRG